MPPLRTIAITLLGLSGAFALPAQSATKSAAPKNPWASKWVDSPTDPLPAGVTHETYRSLSMSHDVGYCIYLPPQYAADPAKRFPVIYELHGNGGTELSALPVAEELDADIRARTCPPYIMVMPNGGLATQYNDSADGKIRPDTTIIKELIPLIDAHYRTEAVRSSRGIEGFSMGSCGAIKFAFEHPELFGSVIAWAGSMPHTAAQAGSKAVSLATQIAYLGPDPTVYQNDDLYLLLHKNIAEIRGRMVIMIVCGTADHFHLTGTRDLHNLLLQLGVDHTYCEVAAVPHNRTELRAVFGNRAFEPHVQALKGKFPPGIPPQPAAK